MRNRLNCPLPPQVIIRSDEVFLRIRLITKKKKNVGIIRSTWPKIIARVKCAKASVGTNKNLKFKFDIAVAADTYMNNPPPHQGKMHSHIMR